MSRLIPTPELTMGPFFPPRYVDAGANDLAASVGRRPRGEPIEIHGRVTQEDGAPMENLVLEIWQPDAAGIFRHPADPRHRDADADFLGWGRAATDNAGGYRFRTIKPGAYAMPDGKRRAPHVNVLLLASGLMRQLQTVIFFDGEPGNDADPVLTAVQPAAVRERLVARRDRSGSYRFDIRLRGDGETPFFRD